MPVEVLLIAQTVVFVALVAWREWRHDQAIRWMVETEAKERDVLVQRVQAPERMPVLPQHFQPQDDRPPEEIEREQAMAKRHREALAAIGTAPQAE